MSYKRYTEGGRTATTGDMLAEKMEECGMSKRRLAREAQVSYRTVCRIMAGDRLGNLDTWMRFADALGCDLSELTRGGYGREA